jgi:predicted nucleic acid-binding protein
MRVVLDTSVIVAGLRSRAGASKAVLQQLSWTRFQIVASPALFLEYEEVLKRREHRAARRFGISVWSPAEMLRILREGEAE